MNNTLYRICQVVAFLIAISLLPCAWISGVNDGRRMEREETLKREPYKEIEEWRHVAGANAHGMVRALEELDKRTDSHWDFDGGKLTEFKK